MICTVFFEKIKSIAEIIGFVHFYRLQKIFQNIIQGAGSHHSVCQKIKEPDGFGSVPTDITGGYRFGSMFRTGFQPD